MKVLSLLSAALSCAVVLGASVTGGTVILMLSALPVEAAEVCYADDRGRIVNRRRPGTYA